VLGDEDCLFINVFTPAEAASAPRPVMVWVHGGGYIAGTGNLDDVSYGSSLEMPASGVVHVTLNYRLGAFGFLFLNNGETVANVGLLDQLSALRWVQSHIHSFGGDPERVTLYGHSAGGASVMALQRMPAAQNLFWAAAALSPVPRIGATPAEAAAAWRHALLPTGCEDVACLRGLPTRTLATINWFGNDFQGSFGQIPDPSRANGGPTTPWVKFIVADGVGLTESWAVDVPMLVSGCREQGDFGSPPDGAPAWPLTRASFGAWAAKAGIDADKAWPLYDGPPRQRWGQIGTDLTLFCGLRREVGHAAAARASPLYLNIFGYAVPFPYLGGLADVEYAAEGIDIWLTWGRPSAEAVGVPIDAEAKAVGDAFRAFLTGFASTATLPAPWQPFPACCEYDGDGLACSEQNAHAQACDVFDAGARRFDLELG